MLYASGVPLPGKDLSRVFQGVGTNAYNTIQSNYAKSKNQLGNEAGVRGLTPGSNSYAATRLPATQGLDIGNLESTIGGDLGDAGYKNTLAERDYQQQRQLAEAAASAMKPSLLEQVLSGIGGGAGALGQMAAFMPRSTRQRSTTMPIENTASYWSPDTGMTYI